MITKKRIRSALRHWGMQEEPVQNIVYPSGFVSENTFQVGKGHFIKAYTVPGKAMNNAQILSALKEAGLSAAAWVPTEDGCVFAADDEFSFLLTEKVPGQTLQVSELFGPDGEDRARYLGQIIGQLHGVLKGNDAIVCNDRNIFEEVRDQWITPAKAAMNLPEAFCREYVSVFGPLHQKLPVQLIHRDPNPNNIILKDGALSGFIDFELSQRSIRLFDPCYAATGILVESGTFAENDDPQLREKWLHIYRSLLHGYDDAAHLTPEEKQALPYVVYSIQLICVGYFCSEEKFHALAQTNMAMLRWLLEHRSDLEF